MQTEPEKLAWEGSSGELAQSHSVSALTLPAFTLANGTLEKISLFLKKINWWGKKKENIAALDKQDLRCKIFYFTVRYKDTEINSRPISCSGLHFGLLRTWGISECGSSKGGTQKVKAKRQRF